MPNVDLRLPATVTVAAWPGSPGRASPGRQLWARRALDLCLAACLLLLLGPLLAVIALCIRLDSPGPVLFRQVRTGFRGAPFVIIKFRTMRRRPRSAMHSALENGSFEQRLRLIQVAQDDRDITRCGRLLRASRLDEAPQLLNVLKGDMALVGPRPHMPALDELFRDALPDIGRRYSVKPGLTGLAQARGQVGATPDAASMAARLASDLVYVERQSLWLDLKILLKTVALLCGYMQIQQGAGQKTPGALTIRSTKCQSTPLHRDSARRLSRATSTRAAPATEPHMPRAASSQSGGGGKDRLLGGNSA